MKILKCLAIVFVVSVFGSGCATKVIQVNVPQHAKMDIVNGYVTIKEVNDLRKFEKSPNDPATPSIEGDLIENKELTDKSIGRMRHGLFHKALWNYTIKGKDNIYDVCREIVIGSLASAGYVTVADGEEGFDKALPVAIDILQFWSWMQPIVNIELNFDGEIRVRSLEEKMNFEVNAKGEHMFSTVFAGGGAWTTLVEEGVKDLDKNLVLKFKGFKEE